MASRGQLKLTADDVKDALRELHPAVSHLNTAMPGQWVVLEEWRNIDLLALDTWRSGEVVGYEVKTSRSDMRSELLKPDKRLEARGMCTRFYFACPAGMITPDELAYKEPVWEPQDFARQPCTNPHCRAGRAHRGFLRYLPKPRGPRLRGTSSEGVSVHLGFDTDRGVDPVHGGTYSHTYEVRACCVVCKGYGTTTKSRVEQEAPTLWVPRDVGLVVVGPTGHTTVIKESPRVKTPEPVIPYPFLGHRRALVDFRRYEARAGDLSRLERQMIAQLVRWASFRPDPRHQHRHRSRQDASYSDTVDE